MSNGKRWLPLAGIVLGLCALLLLPTAVQAEWTATWFDDLGPEWLKYEAVITVTENPNSVTHWYDPPIPDGMSSYEYRSAITKIEAAFAPGPSVWLDLTALFGDPWDLYVEGTEFSLGFPIIHEEVRETGTLEVDLDHGVVWDPDTSQYRLNTSLTGALLGEYAGNQIYGFRATFQTGINAVPEPGSLALMGMGGLLGVALWRRRRK